MSSVNVVGNHCTSFGSMTNHHTAKSKVRASLILFGRVGGTHFSSSSPALHLKTELKLNFPLNRCLRHQKNWPSKSELFPGQQFNHLRSIASIKKGKTHPKRQVALSTLAFYSAVCNLAIESSLTLPICLLGSRIAQNWYSVHHLKNVEEIFVCLDLVHSSLHRCLWGCNSEKAQRRRESKRR